MVSEQKVYRITPRDLTLDEIKRKIPKKLFERSLVKSFFYIFHDIFWLCLVFLTFQSLIKICPEIFHYPIILSYWLIQGTIFTGIWIIAHECGHGAFSEHNSINDIVGLILHSIVFVPYFSWKFSHSKHHNHTGHMDKEVAYCPYTEKDHKESPYTDVPIYKFFSWLFLGLPLYFSLNLTGQKYDKWTNHFLPSSPIFTEEQKNKIIISDLGLIVFTLILFYISYLTSVKDVFIWYFVPYLIVNMWIVIITYLHHTHTHIPHYRENEWTYVRGSLATVDRNYGWLINHFHHHIGDTHILHHLFPRLPHYNAVEATHHLKLVLGDYYFYDNQFFLSAFWHNLNDCLFVPDHGNILFWRKKYANSQNENISTINGDINLENESKSNGIFKHTIKNGHSNGYMN